MKLRALLEDHEAIKIHYSNEQRDGKVIEIYSGSDKVTLRIRGIPNELVLKRDDHKSHWRQLMNVLHDSELKTKLEEVKELKGEAAATAAYKMLYDGVELDDGLDKLEAELNEELKEVFDHITTLLKTKLVEHAQNMDDHIGKISQEYKKTMLKKLDAILKDGK